MSSSYIVYVVYCRFILERLYEIHPSLVLLYIRLNIFFSSIHTFVHSFVHASSIQTVSFEMEQEKE